MEVFIKDVEIEIETSQDGMFCGDNCRFSKPPAPGAPKGYCSLFHKRHLFINHVQKII